jgi:hypothetical protein
MNRRYARYTAELSSRLKYATEELIRATHESVTLDPQSGERFPEPQARAARREYFAELREALSEAMSKAQDIVNILSEEERAP